jgi:hypothetical protein
MISYYIPQHGNGLPQQRQLLGRIGSTALIHTQTVGAFHFSQQQIRTTPTNHGDLRKNSRNSEKLQAIIDLGKVVWEKVVCNC